MCTLLIIFNHWIYTPVLKIKTPSRIVYRPDRQSICLFARQFTIETFHIVTIVLPRSNDHVYICLFVNIEIKTLGWHIQQSVVVLKTILYQQVESLAADNPIFSTMNMQIRIYP